MWPPERVFSPAPHIVSSVVPHSCGSRHPRKQSQPSAKPRAGRPCKRSRCLQRRATAPRRSARCPHSQPDMTAARPKTYPPSKRPKDNTQTRPAEQVLRRAGLYIFLCSLSGAMSGYTTKLLERSARAAHHFSAIAHILHFQRKSCSRGRNSRLLKPEHPSAAPVSGVPPAAEGSGAQLFFSWKRLTSSRSVCACADSSSLDAAVSCAVALLVCTTWEICSTPAATCVMEFACWSVARSI